jgi:hypothetical protein
LAIRAVFWHFFEKGKSGRFTGDSGIGFRETGADSGPDLGWGRDQEGVIKRRESFRKIAFKTNPVVDGGLGMERAAKGSPDRIRIQSQRLSRGTGEKKEL